MVKKTHIQGGILFGLIAAPIIWRYSGYGKMGILNIVIGSIYFFSCYWASLLPDIDMKKSYISKKVPVLYYIIGRSCKHRGVTHSWVGVLVMSLFGVLMSRYLDGNIFILAFAQGCNIGYISHIFLDLCTKEGVAFFYPIKRSVNLFNMKTGKYGEKKLNKILDFIMYFAIGIYIYIYI